MMKKLAILFVAFLFACSAPEPLSVPDPQFDEFPQAQEDDCEPTSGSYGDYSRMCSSAAHADGWAYYYEQSGTYDRCYSSGRLFWCYE